MDRTLSGDREVGIVRGPVLAAWEYHTDPRGLLRAEGGGAHAGLSAHRHGHVLVADLRGPQLHYIAEQQARYGISLNHLTEQMLLIELQIQW